MWAGETSRCSCHDGPLLSVTLKGRAVGTKGILLPHPELPTENIKQFTKAKCSEAINLYLSLGAGPDSSQGLSNHLEEGLGDLGITSLSTHLFGATSKHRIPTRICPQSLPWHRQILPDRGFNFA